MLSQTKWVRFATTVLVVLALLCGSTLAKKPPKDPPPDPPPVIYELTLLDELPFADAMGMNESGEVVGVARPDGVWTPFLYTPELGMLDLNLLLPAGSGWRLIAASDINDLGQIVGDGEINGESRGFRFTPAMVNDGVPVPAVIDDLGKLHTDDQWLRAKSINNAGEVCGFGNKVNGERFAWYYNDVVGIQPVLEEFPQVSAYSINNAGQILGIVRGVAPPPVFKVIPGSAPEFFFADGDSLTANDMNDSGHFVGVGQFNVQVRKRTRLKYRAFRHNGSDFFDLGTGDDSSARGINNADDVVGTLASNGYRISAFVYLESEQEAICLDNAVVGDAADLALWVSEYSSVLPERISEAGQICGRISNVNSDYAPAFILTPIPPEN